MPTLFSFWAQFYSPRMRSTFLARERCDAFALSPLMCRVPDDGNKFI